MGCKFKCTSNSAIITPSFYINGGCYSIGEVADIIKGSTIERDHPNYTIVYNCTSGLELRCVYSVDQYSPAYTTLEFSSAELCGVTPDTPPGAETESPGITPNTTMPNTTATVDNGSGVVEGIASATLGVVIIIMAIVILIAVIICAWCWKRCRSLTGDAHVQAVHPHGTMTSDDDSHDGEVGVDVDLPTVMTGVASTSTPTLTPGTLSVAEDASDNDTSSSVTGIANGSFSETRVPPAGGEEILPFPIPSVDDASLTEFVPVIIPQVFGE